MSGDQVSKKGGMTGGFYDFRRSKLKFVNIIRQSKMSIHAKTAELDDIGSRLKDILWNIILFLCALDLSFTLSACQLTSTIIITLFYSHGYTFSLIYAFLE